MGQVDLCEAQYRRTNTSFSFKKFLKRIRMLILPNFEKLDPL